jgi:hypothetical protein
MCNSIEPMMGIEPMTPSLPWKCSTPELHRLGDKFTFLTSILIRKCLLSFTLSGRRDSNSRPSAWKADALPTELLPPFLAFFVGVVGFEPTQSETPDLQSGPALLLRRTPYYKSFRITIALFSAFEPVEGFEPPTS